jgi:hypothetical protein
MVKSNPFKMKGKEDAKRGMEPLVHLYGKDLKVKCITEGRGYKTPGNRPPAKLVLEASPGYVPLWKEGQMLRWRFQESSMSRFEDPDAAKNAVKDLMVEALQAWGKAAPIKFTQDNDLWDFEIVLKNTDECEGGGCVLASSFFPEVAQDELDIYPMMFTQSREEQIGTLEHELGHIFCLRHFFAQISETAWASQIYGKHVKFTIMNYGPDSKLTQDDIDDLTTLYEKAWSGELTNINETPIKFMVPFSAYGGSR